MGTHSTLDKFRRSINMNLALGILADEELPVVDNVGRHPVVAALGEERLAVLLRRIENLGGYANVFVLCNGRVRGVSFIDAACAIDASNAEDLAADNARPGTDATVGMFLDYLEMKPNGVRLPARIEQESPFVPTPREVVFA